MVGYRRGKGTSLAKVLGWIILLLASATACGNTSTSARVIGKGWPDRGQTGLRVLPPKQTSPGHESPAAAFTGLVHDLNIERYTDACQYFEPVVQEQCHVEMTETAPYSFRVFSPFAIGYVVVNGDKALVGWTGSLCIAGTASPVCTVNQDPAGGFDGSSFEAIWDAAAQNRSPYSTTSYGVDPAIRVGGSWYNYRQPIAASTNTPDNSSLIDPSIPLPANFSVKELGRIPNGLVQVSLRWWGSGFSYVLYRADGDGVFDAAIPRPVGGPEGGADFIDPGATYTYYLVAKRSVTAPEYSPPVAVTVSGDGNVFDHPRPQSAALAPEQQPNWPGSLGCNSGFNYATGIDPSIPAPTELAASVQSSRLGDQTRQIQLTWHQPRGYSDSHVYQAAAEVPFSSAADCGGAAGSPGVGFVTVTPGHRYTFYVVVNKTSDFERYSPPASITITVP